MSQFFKTPTLTAYDELPIATQLKLNGCVGSGNDNYLIDNLVRPHYSHIIKDDGDEVIGVHCDFFGNCWISIDGYNVPGALELVPFLNQYKLTVK